MKTAEAIPLLNLLLIFIPVVVVGLVFYSWKLKWKTLLYANIRMVLQLLLCGYALTFIFHEDNLFVSLGVLVIMVTVASWIALRPIKDAHKNQYIPILISQLIGGGPVLLLVVGGVVALEPWYKPQYLIPLAGMIFANGMNNLSLCAERFFAERKRGVGYEEARNIAYETALIPLVNSFFAVGLVSLPGMMTGQILAGISPLIAVRYQIMVMCMIIGSSGIASAVYLKILKKGF